MKQNHLVTAESEPFRRDLSLAVEELARYVVALERAMGDPRQPGGGVVDTPGLGVLLALQIFGPLRPSTLAELLAMRSGTTSKRIERLERASFVARKVGVVPEDRRGVIVEIQEGGRLEIDRIERVALAMGVDLLRALQPLTVERPAIATAPAEPQAPPVLTALFRFVSLIDHTVIRAVGDHDLLHPSDPRPLLLLADLDRNGPRPPGSIPALLDRSRSATHRMVSQLAAESLIATTTPTAAQPRPLTCIAPNGHRALQSVLTALDEDLPSLQPAIGDLTGSLTSSRSLGGPQ
jgi:DNA-binding MarR family transcriptional regulator